MKNRGIWAVTLLVAAVPISSALGAGGDSDPKIYTPPPSSDPTPPTAAPPKVDAPSPSLFQTTVTLGASAIHYKEGRTADIAMTGLTAKAQVFFRIAPRWDLASSGYITAAQLSSNNAATMRFLGLNFRAGYAFYSSKAWQLSLLVGGYYTTMLVDGARFGFKDMTGPQIFPLVRHQMNPKTSVALYVKYSPILSDSSIALSREIASGISYLRRLSGTLSIAAGIDVADIALVISNVAISSQSISFGVGFGW